MKPIISPWLIYFLSVLDGVNIVCAGIFILGLIGIPAALLVLYWMNDTTYGKEGEAAKKKPFPALNPILLLTAFSSAWLVLSPARLPFIR